MNQKSFLSVKSTALISAVLAVISSVMRICFLFTAVEPDNGLYKFESVAEYVFKFTVIISVIAVTVLCFISVKKSISFPLPKPTHLIATSALLGLLLLFVFVYNVYRLVANPAYFNLLFVLETLLSLASCVYFFNFACENNYSLSLSGKILSLCPPVFMAVRIIAYFLDTTVVITASQRHLMLLYMCCAMLFLLYDARFAIPEPSKQKEDTLGDDKKGLSRLFILWGTLSVYFSFCGVFSHFTVWALGAIKPDIPELYYVTDIVMGVYIASKIFAGVFKKSEN